MMAIIIIEEHLDMALPGQSQKKNNRSDNKPGGSQEVAILVTFASLFQSTGIFYHLQLFSHSFLVLLGHESTKANLPGRKLDLVRNYF